MSDTLAVVKRGRGRPRKNPVVEASQDILTDVVPAVVEALSSPENPHESPVANLPGGMKRVGRPRKDRQELVKAAAKAVGLTISEPPPKLDPMERPEGVKHEAKGDSPHPYWHLLRLR